MEYIQIFFRVQFLPVIKSATFTKLIVKKIVFIRHKTLLAGYVDSVITESNIEEFFNTKVHIEKVGGRTLILPEVKYYE